MREGRREEGRERERERENTEQVSSHQPDHCTDLTLWTEFEMNCELYV